MAATSLVGICRRASAFLKAACSLVNPKDAAHSGVNYFIPRCQGKDWKNFFDDPKNWGEEKVKSGASWTCQQLRNKSNEDLHKLWYVLLKERNMLLTLEQEAKRQRLPMPSPERLEKAQIQAVAYTLVPK